MPKSNKKFCFLLVRQKMNQMTEYIVKIQHIEQINHDVRRLRVDKPSGYSFIPGQATGVSINRPELRKKRRSFTFTGLNSDPYLEFTIKIYPEHQGLTQELENLKSGDEMVIGVPYGAISFKGRGIFIAGGAGITPFLAIFRDLHSRNELTGNLLFLANKTRADIILEQELEGMLGRALINVLSREKVDGYRHGHITEQLMREVTEDFSGQFYLCGPPEMVKSMTEILTRLGVDRKAVIMDL